MQLKVGDIVTMNLPGNRFHGQSFEITKANARHQFVIARALKRFDDYRKGDELRFSGTLLSGLEAEAPKKTARQLDADIAHALVKRTWKPAPNVRALFDWFVELAEIQGTENLVLARRDEGYTGDKMEFRFSDIFGKRFPAYKYDRLIDLITEAEKIVYTGNADIGRRLTSKEAEWMSQQASAILKADKEAYR